MKTVLHVFLSLLLVSFSGQLLAFEVPFDVDSSEARSIEFIQLEAVSSARIVHFKWDVAWEQNGKYFIIEKSVDGEETWREISRVKSVENHNERHTYEISEINMAEEAREIFRISRVDVNGNVQVLDKVDINHPILSNLKLIPDPKRVHKMVTVSCESMIDSEGEMYVYDAAGDLVLVKSMPMSDGYNRLELSIKNFNPGRYRVVVRNQFSDAVSRTLTVH